MATLLMQTSVDTCQSVSEEVDDRCFGRGKSIPALTLSETAGEDGLSSSACFPEDLPEDFGGNFTVCAFIKPMEKTAIPQVSGLSTEDQDLQGTEENGGFDGVIFSIKYNSTFMEASFVDSKLVVTYGNMSHTFGTPFETNVWRRVCVYYDPYDSKVHSLVGDYYAGEIGTEDARNDTSELYDRFCLGSTNDSLSSFSGTLAAVSVNLWNVSKEATEYFYPTDCSNFINENSFCVLDTTWNLQGATILSDYDASMLCNDAFEPITINTFGGHKLHLDICASMNGRFMTEGEVSDDLIEGIVNITESSSSVNNKLFWFGGKVNGSGLQTYCSAASANGTSGIHPCISKLPSSVCLIPTRTSFTLYGKIYDQDRDFTFLPLENGKFSLKGKETSEIYHNGTFWVLSSHLHDDDWYLPDSILPCGRNVWQSSQGNLTLTVTQCNQGHFTCNNGDCILEKRRCDGNEDCSNGEDENDCDIIRLNKGYDKNKSPGNGRPIQEFLYYGVAMYSISDITTTDGKVTIDFLIYLSWYEYRLKFWNLGSKPQYFPCEMIWTPKLSAIAGYTDGQAFDLDTYDKKCSSYSYNLLRRRAFDDHLMGSYLDGHESSIYMDIYSRLTIPCHFKLHRYPFGSYFCNISLYILNDRDKMAFKSYDEETVNTVYYKGRHDLLEFRLEKITHETLHDLIYNIDYTNLLVTLHLDSLYDYHILNSFGTSSLIFIISFSTFFFPIEDFNERIMVTLTALLVLAALFAQASTLSVRTPYYKLIDVWYAALISLCFSAVIMITCVNAMRSKKSPDVSIKVKPIGRLWCTTTTFPSPSRNRAFICNFVSKIILMSLFIVLVIIYVFFAIGKL
ncbi:uncharacterized protein [Palaemon carinicauda]|uniref:uncharacterized protein n=1 Tax=Palaemon carinicauda TaxID=392227 RepID=UPI0035B683DF